MKSGDLIRPRAYATIGHEVHVAATEAKRDQLAAHRERMLANDEAEAALQFVVAAIMFAAAVAAVLWMVFR